MRRILAENEPDNPYFPIFLPPNLLFGGRIFGGVSKHLSLGDVLLEHLLTTGTGSRCAVASIQLV